MKKLSTVEVIQRFRKVNGDKYDYSKVEYVNARTKVCIICPEHGEFWQKPNDHARGIGCPECNKERLKSGARRLTKDEFLKKAIEIHGGKYDYSKVDYIDCRTKVCIICPEHGEFWQRPSGHLSGKGCPKCSKKYMDKEYFIENAKKIYGEKYDYTKTDYVNHNTKVCVTCKEHGDFLVNPNDFLHGHGCKKCANVIRAKKLKKSTEEFVNEANKIHGNKYNYSKVEYVNNRTKICIICPEHGEFWQMPIGHLLGYGCPICNESHLEKEVKKILNEKNINFEQYKRFNWLGLQSLDFYLCNFNIGIECQGIQHFEEVEHFGGKKGLIENKRRDKQKLQLCKEHGVDVFYINYNDNVSDKIFELLSKYGL